MKTPTHDDIEVRAVLEEWALATRQKRVNDILKNHAVDSVFFDVLPPMKYEGVKSYRLGWESWQPKTQGSPVFNLEDLSITASESTAFAYGFLRCGGTLLDGRTFQDLARATFCLNKVNGSWIVQHQHISKPFEHT